MFNAILALALIFSSFLTALAALLGFAIFSRNKGKSLNRLAKSEKNKITFLFEDENLADSTSAARQILKTANVTGSDWGKLVFILKSRFDGVSNLASNTLESGFVSLVSSDGTSRLDAELADGMLRLDLLDVETSEPSFKLDRHSLTAFQDELETHRATATNVPYLNWRENSKGEIIWANRAYLVIAEIVQSNKTVISWPPVQLFENIKPPEKKSNSAKQRVALALPGDDNQNWFEIHSASIGQDTLFTATPIDEVVKAEETLSEFVTTLTGTFAHLTIGLAIFDQERKLSLFNPALTDLTMLPAEFLCGQPTLFAFLDRLREKRMMPEPKNYKTWRQEMSELEEKAITGTYSKTWFLPTGQTYRVTGRPHPGGAVAFLFEDISSEISLTHRFRAELEMGRSALDCLDEAVAVFTSGGVLSMTNTAYASLWGGDPSTSLSDINVSDATTAWNQKCCPTPVWRQLRGYVSEQGERKRWVAPVTMQDGRVLNCRITPMIEGATMVTFAQSAPKHTERVLEPVSEQTGS